MASSDNLGSVLKFGHASRTYTTKFAGNDLKEFDSSLDVIQKAYDVKTAKLDVYEAQAAGAASLAAKCLREVVKKYGVDTAALDDMIGKYDEFLAVYSYGAAFTGDTLASAATCAAAWGGAGVAHVGIKGPRGLDPNLRTDLKTDQLQNDAFGKIGGGAAGVVGAPPGAAAGATPGGAAGSVVAAIAFAIKGPPPPSDGCIFYVEGGSVDVTVKVWGPGGGLLGYDYKVHTEFNITPGTYFIEKGDPRNIQLIVNGNWHELKDVIRTYKAIGIADDGKVHKVTR